MSAVVESTEKHENRSVVNLCSSGNVEIASTLDSRPAIIIPLIDPGQRRQDPNVLIRREAMNILVVMVLTPIITLFVLYEVGHKETVNFVDRLWR